MTNAQKETTWWSLVVSSIALTFAAAVFYTVKKERDFNDPAKFATYRVMCEGQKTVELRFSVCEPSWKSTGIACFAGTGAPVAIYGTNCSVEMVRTPREWEEAP